MPLQQGDKNDISWDWVEKLSKTEDPKAASISSFPHVPLASSADSMIFYGTVAELLTRDENGDYTDSDDEHRANSKGGYWFVKVVDIAGYFVKIEYLGYPEEQAQLMRQLQRWVPYVHLKALGHYNDSSIRVVPPGPIQETMESMMERLYLQLVGKMTILHLREKIITWDYRIDWKIGQKVEVRDKDCVNQMKYGYVGKILGRRVYICYWDSKIHLKDGIWCHADSNEVHLPGWSATVGATLCSTVAAIPPLLEEHQLDFKVIDPVDAGIEKEMYFEFVNPIRLNEIAVGKVKKVLKHGFFICEIVSHVSPEDLKEFARMLNEFIYHITSPYIFPCGTCAENNVLLNPPAVCDIITFDWDVYLSSIGGSKLPVPEKERVDGDGKYEKGMLVEAADYHKPELVCPATIVTVMNPYAIKIRFLGWGKEFDQWKPFNSSDVYPIGWCDLVQFPLAPPGTVDVEFPEFAPIEIQKISQSAAEEKVEMEPIQKEIKSRNVDIIISKSDSDTSVKVNSRPVKQKRKARRNPRAALKEEESFTNDTITITESETDASNDQNLNSSQSRRKGRKNVPIKYAGNKIVADDAAAEPPKKSKTKIKQPIRDSGIIEEVCITSDGSAPELETNARPRRSRKKTEFFGENVDTGLLR